MALNKQIHIYSVDTDDFYTLTERKIHRNILRYGKHKNTLKEILKKLKNENYTKEEQNRYKKVYSFTNKKLKTYKEMLKKEFANSNNILRILNPKNINDKKVISVFESTLTRTIGLEINQLFTDIIVVQTFFYEVIEQLIKNGFMYDGDKYKYFTSSAGQIRLKKTVFIKQSLWDKYEKSLMCGLTIDNINAKGGINVNKFLAYLALSNSATDLWEDFNIDKCIVVKDFETEVNGEVDYISDTTYQIERKKMPVPITHTDGCGMILPKLSKKNFMIRLPWVKGLLASFDYVKFIKKHNCSPIITDIYNKEWDIIDNDIQIIFTESQFKMYKYYSDWEEYKTYFKEYNCQAGICNMEEDYFSRATINYQMMQTLTRVSEEEIEKIISPSLKRLYNLSRNKRTMLNVFGVVDSNKNKTSLQQALEIYPELLQDEYCKHVLRQIKNSLLKKYKSAKLDVYGKYTFLIPDLYAFCERLFLGMKDPNGLLKNGEVYCKLFKQSDKLDCLRSPHLFAEHAIRDNIINDEKNKWFKTDAIYTSIHDLISKILQFDNDGDKSLVIADNDYVAIADKNMKLYNSVPLYYDMKKAEPVELNSDNIWQGLNAAFSGGNIGVYSNDISKIWNSEVFISGTEEEKDEALNVIKLLCMENNFVIDYAKTLYKPVRPDDVNDVISKYTKDKVPHFFIYAKDKTKNQVVKTNGSLVNSFEKQFKNTPLRFNVKNFGKLNYRNLMSNKFIEIDDNVINKYIVLNRTYHFKINQKNQNNVNYIIGIVKEKLLSLSYCESDITDMLVKYLYSRKKTPHKEILWKCFGENIVKNLKNNIPVDSIQCEKCGERFIPNAVNQKLCELCGTYQPIGTKTITCIDCSEEVEVDAKDNKTERCEKCREIHLRELKRLEMQRYRAKKNVL